MDAHHRRLQPDARDLGLKLALELSCVMRDICRAAHVESNHLLIISQRGCMRRIKNSADWAGQNDRKS